MKNPAFDNREVEYCLDKSSDDPESAINSNGNSSEDLCYDVDRMIYEGCPNCCLISRPNKLVGQQREPNIDQSLL